MDGNGRGSSGWEPGDVDTFYDESNQLMTVVPVLEGTHTFSLSVYEANVTSASTQYANASITAQYFHQAS